MLARRHAWETPLVDEQRETLLRDQTRFGCLTAANLLAATSTGSLGTVKHGKAHDRMAQSRTERRTIPRYKQATKVKRRQGRRNSSANSDRSPAAKATRYWLRNDTYVDLAVPYEKIGLPFGPAEFATALTRDEKRKVIIELSKCKPDVHAGNLHVLEFALEICRRCQAPAPVWLLPYAIEAINKLLKLGRRTRLKMLQREIHQLRWATVHHLRVSRRLTWDTAYEEAKKELYYTRARASEETLRASYKWMNRHPFIESMRKYGLPVEVDAFAREQYENRHVTSQRLILLST
jgi:hypothetical protein